MKKLIFENGKRISKQGEKPVKYSSDRGYYFKGEFLHLYKSHALKIIGEKMLSDCLDFKQAKEVHPDEWQLIHREFLKSRRSIKKAAKKKQWYYLKQRIQSKKDKIERLKEEIKNTKEQL